MVYFANFLLFFVICYDRQAKRRIENADKDVLPPSDGQLSFAQ